MKLRVAFGNRSVDRVRRGEGRNYGTGQVAARIADVMLKM